MDPPCNAISMAFLRIDYRWIYSLQSPYSRRCKYGGEDEYYIEVRETGNRQQEKLNQEQTVETTQETFIPFPLCLPSHTLNQSEATSASQLHVAGPIACQEDGGASLPDVTLDRVEANMQRDQASASSAVAATSEAGNHFHLFN